MEENLNSIVTFKSLIEGSNQVSFTLKYGLCSFFERSPNRDICIPGNGKPGEILIPNISTNRRIDGSVILILASEKELDKEHRKVIILRNMIFFDSMIFAKTDSGKLYCHKYFNGSLSLHVSDFVYKDIKKQVNY